MPDIDNPYVAFLASYGPQPSANNLYDEFVVATAAKTKCSPLEIKQPLVDEIVSLLRSDAPQSVILTGTAGDGKTYTARKVLEAISGGSVRWMTTQKTLDFFLSGRRIVFVKDLSELKEAEKDKIFPEICASLRGEAGADTWVICVNDGQLLRFFRDRSQSQADHALHARLREMLRLNRRDDPEHHFRMVNMSRQPHDAIVDQVFDQIVQSPAWNDCARCPVSNDPVARCPIRINLDLLATEASGSIRARLKDMIRIAAADGRHLSIRQIILLTVNLLLGDQKSGSALLTCSKARSRAAQGDYALTNPFANAFGDNLGIRQRRRYGAFAVLGDFGVGEETNNWFDGQLLRLPDDDNDGDTPIPDQPVYGEAIFAALKRAYRANPADKAAELRAAMVNQRRRVFFSLDPAGRAGTRSDPWRLTRYKHGGAWIRLLDALENDEPPPRDVVRRLVQGLNRMMTGSMTQTDKELWLTRPSGVYRGRETPLLITQIPARFASGQERLVLEKPRAKGAPPVLAIVRAAPQGDGRAHRASLALKPILFECLCRIADGALPASFSTQHLQDFERFRLTAATSYEREASQSQQTPSLSVIDTTESQLAARQIDVLDRMEAR